MNLIDHDRQDHLLQYHATSRLFNKRIFDFPCSLWFYSGNISHCPQKKKSRISRHLIRKFDLLSLGDFRRKEHELTSWPSLFAQYTAKNGLSHCLLLSEINTAQISVFLRSKSINTCFDPWFAPIVQKLIAFHHSCHFGLGLTYFGHSWQLWIDHNWEYLKSEWKWIFNF